MGPVQIAGNGMAFARRKTQDARRKTQDARRKKSGPSAANRIDEPPGTKFSRWFGPVLDALRALGDSGSPDEVIERIANDLHLPESFLNEQLPSGESRLRNQVHFARFNNALVSMKVMFQRKRYAGSVTASHIRDFCGAMQRRADKGIVITTGSFTAEASHDGVPQLN